MLQGAQRAFKASELRGRLLFTLLMLGVFRLGVYLTVPGVDVSRLQQLVQSGQVNLFGLLNLFSGGAFFTFSIFAMSVVPYINASIIMQLLTMVLPSVEELSKEGMEGYKKMTQYTRYLTVGLAVLQSVGVTISLNRIGVLSTPGVGSVAFIAMMLTAGSVVLMWIGEQITERGIGNGISLIIFTGIVVQIPTGVGNIFSYLSAGTISIFNVVLLLVAGLVVIGAVVAVQEAERRIPVQYARRLVGRNRMSQQISSHIPVKINPSGVIPVIFAISILVLPQTLATYWPASFLKTVLSYIGFGSPLNVAFEFVLVVIFTFFYTGVVFKPDQMADDLRKYGGFIPGIRPGKPTAQFIGKVSGRLTVVGALFLGIIAILPTFFSAFTGVPNLYFGGTALLIVVGVALDTMKQIQSQMLMRNYQGLLK